jgi:(E)-4-hydroxy-3-methylbut-2-enyl-diphosphate synthase
VPKDRGIIVNVNHKQDSALNEELIPMFDLDHYSDFSEMQNPAIRFIRVRASELTNMAIEVLKKDPSCVLVIETNSLNGFADQRAAIIRLINQNCKVPVIVKRNYHESLVEDLQLKSAADLGGLFIDGLADGIWIENEGIIQEKGLVNTAFGILQASRVRVSKTEYISCPSCGRTLFDLQTTIKKIQEQTSHLKNLKIGIMGCIVNGPGEMADADYGYVGSGKGQITLYKGQTVVKRNIPELEAVRELIALIKENGDWVEP